MKGFIKITDSSQVERYIAVDQIKSWHPDDEYRPNQGARILLKDGSAITTSFRDNVESVAELVAGAS